MRSAANYLRQPQLLCRERAFRIDGIAKLGVHGQPGRVLENQDVGMGATLRLEPGHSPTNRRATLPQCRSFLTLRRIETTDGSFRDRIETD